MGKKAKTRSFLSFFCALVPIEFQTILNIIGLVGVSVISYGLWTCMGELEKLKEINGNVATSIAQLTQRPEWSGENSQSILSDGDKLSRPDIIKTDNFHSQRSKRETSMRGSNIPDFVYDPFSQTDRVR